VQVADLVKRRMSTRFPMAGEQGRDAPPMPMIPSMPSIPAGAGAKVPPSGAKSRTGPGPEVDISLFREPAFNPDQCTPLLCVTDITLTSTQSLLPSSPMLPTKRSNPSSASSKISATAHLPTCRRTSSSTARSLS
jgi:hypothetical protein